MDELRPLALVTNASGYAGPAAVDCLLEKGFHVVAHDKSFSDQGKWQEFRIGRHQSLQHLQHVSHHDPESLVAHLKTLGQPLKTVISNDHYPAPALDPVSAPAKEFYHQFQFLMEWPFLLIRELMPFMGAHGGGNIVMITSNRMDLPLSGGAFSDAARAGANALMRSLSRDCAPYGIALNALAPNFLNSEAFYPKAIFKDSQKGRDYIKANLPIGRLAEASEIGEVIAFLATVKTRFLTGAIIDFSGGWPYGPARPWFDDV